MFIYLPNIQKAFSQITYFSTFGLELEFRTVRKTIGGLPIKEMVWDSVGKEKFRAKPFYDITNRGKDNHRIQSETTEKIYAKYGLLLNQANSDEERAKYVQEFTYSQRDFITKFLT